MEALSHSPAAQWPHGRIIPIEPKERHSLDRVTLLRLAGEAPAEDGARRMCRLAESIAQAASILRDLADDGHMAKVSRHAPELGRLAADYGLHSVRMTADHLSDAALSGCERTVAATLARLERAVDHALTSIWDLCPAV